MYEYNGGVNRKETSVCVFHYNTSYFCNLKQMFANSSLNKGTTCLHTFFTENTTFIFIFDLPVI